MHVRLRLLSAPLVVLIGGCASAQGGDDVPMADARPHIDAPEAPDATPDAAPDAEPPDAALPPSEVVSLTPPTIEVPRGADATFTVTLDRPALAGGQVVMLDTDDVGGSHLTVPLTATVLEGQLSATFLVTTVAVGGPFQVSASLGTSTQSSSIVIVPALIGVAPMGSSDLTVGTSGTYVVTLEAASPSPVTVALAAAPAGVVTIPASVTVPMGGATASFPVTGSALGGPVVITASVGGVSVQTTARVLGLYFSEILYDVASTDTNWEWVEMYNASGVPIDVTGFKIRAAISPTVGYEDTLTLAGTVGAGACVVVGGPNVGATNFTPATFVYFLAGDFSPDLGNAGSMTGDAGDGLSLVTASGDVVDNVLYGRDNSDLYPDENGVTTTPPAVGDAPSGQSIERISPGLDGAWTIQLMPNPGDCTAVSM